MSAAKLLPELYPRLRDGAICVSMGSTIIYFFTSEGVSNFLQFVINVCAKLLHP
jgi:hypothetical protein